MSGLRKVKLTVNGVPHEHEVEPRLLLADFLRSTLGLTGTHVGCEHGVCGACTVMVDGDSARACLMFAVQADGCAIVTVEGLGTRAKMSPLQQAFHEHHALQCGFCTPGMLITVTDLIQKYPLGSDAEIRDGLSGNLCRCTGYEHIVQAVRAVVGKSERPRGGKTMKMHFLSGGRLRMRKSVYLPDADRAETIEIPVACVLLRHPQGNVLFDTGCHPSVADDPQARWGTLAKFTVPIMPPGDNVLTALGAAGLKADDIDVVVCSHLHPDHCGCNEFFKRATVMIHAKELEAARAPDAQQNAGYFAADWDHPLKTDAIEGDRDLFGDNRIVLVPLPGHTPGTMGALVVLENSGTFFLASDTVSLRATLDTRIIPKNTWNGGALAKSLAEVARIEAGGATIICGHDAAQWQTLRQGAAFYD